MERQQGARRHIRPDEKRTASQLPDEERARLRCEFAAKIAAFNERINEDAVARAGLTLAEVRVESML